MVTLNGQNFSLGVINNIIIIDEENNVLFSGDIISGLLYGEKGRRGTDIFSGFPGEKEKKLLAENIASVRSKKITGSFFHEGANKNMVVFPANYGSAGVIVVSFEDEIINVGIISSELRERVKELQCLYDISFEINAAKTLDEVFENSINHVRNGFQFSDITVVTVKLGGKIYGDPERKEGISSLEGRIVVSGEDRGWIRVAYTEERAFLEEERQLLKEIADSFSKTIERVESRVDLEKKKQILEKKNLRLLELTEECARNREKLETLIDAITDRIYVVENDGTISMSNDRDIGDTDNKFENFCLQEFLDHDSGIMNIFSSGESVMVEKKIDNLYFSIRVYPISSSGGSVDKALVMCSNITRSKELENQMLQSNKLASLGKLVAGIAHEINNPNTFIRGNLKIIKESFDDIFPVIERSVGDRTDLKIARLDYKVFKENVPFLINDMFEGSNRIKKIVDDLRNYARKDEGFLTDDIDINLVINNAYRLVESQTRRMAKVRLDLSGDLPVFKGNFQKLEQVIVNMILNAAQSITGQDGSILIRTGKPEGNDRVEIAISDNGKGIDENIIGSIFDPFFTTKRASGGTGLGLSISYGIIKEHGGDIRVTSAPGEGTEFIISLPVSNGNKK